MKNKLFIIVFLLIVAIAIFLGALKFFSAAENIYEFENPSKSEIIGQFRKILIPGDIELRKSSSGETNILFLGIGGPGHSGENLTDTIIILTISQDQKRATINSIPRDLCVELPENQYWGKINAVYARDAKNNPKKGIKALSEEIKKISGLPVNYYVIVNFEGFKKIIDLVGGIDYALEKDLYDPSFPDNNFGYDPLNLKAGVYHLDGELALKLSRSRHTLGGDLSRIERQHKIIKLLKEKVEKNNFWDNFFKVADILNIVGENVKTDISLPQMQKLSAVAKNIDEIQSKIPNTDLENGLLSAAKINEADVLLPKDGTYEELRKFYQE